MCLIIEGVAPFRMKGEDFLVTRCLIFPPELIGVVYLCFMGDLVEMFESIRVNGLLGKKSSLMKEWGVVVSLCELFKRDFCKIFSFVDFHNVLTLLLILFYNRVFF